MQEFCKKICEENKIEKKGIKKVKLGSNVKLDKIFMEIAKNSGRELFEKLARGPRQRSDRIHRQLKNGEQTDIYGVVMEGLKKLKPGVCSISYEEFRSCLKEIIDDANPIEEQYFLEISSPGIERLLRKDWQLKKFKGADVNIKLFKKDENGKKEYTGTLGDITENTLDVEADGKNITIDRKIISQVKTVYTE